MSGSRGTAVGDTGGRAALSIALGCLACGCIDQAPGTRDTGPAPSETTLPDVAEVAAGDCRIDADCPRAPDACGRARCDAGVCTVGAISCDDGNGCTTDGCDPVAGCVFAAARAGTACRVGDGSDSCVGEVYHQPDVCDGEGSCRDHGVEDCGQWPGSACYRYACVITPGVGGGCELTPRADGLACSADGLSSECADGALHGADVCIAGECVDAGSARCPAGFCEEARCDGDGGCESRPIGVERILRGNWLMFEMFATGDGAAPRLATVQSGFAFGGDGTVTTYGALTSVPQASPGDGSYCVSDDGDLRFALPYGAVAPAPHKVYRGVVAGGDDFALVFREVEPSLGMLVRLPTGNAPKLVGNHRILGIFRRKVIGSRALLGEIAFDAQGCITGGGVRFSDEFETVPIDPGECQGVFAWLVGLRIGFAGESYLFRGTTLAGGEMALMSLHSDEDTVGDGLLLIMREQDLRGATREGRHTFARFDVHDEVITAARGAALLAGDGYVDYTESTLGGETLGGEGGLQLASDHLGGHIEQTSFGPVRRRRLGQGGAVTLGRVGLFVDVAVPLTPDERLASPLGSSLRISIVRP